MAVEYVRENTVKYEAVSTAGIPFAHTLPEESPETSPRRHPRSRGRIPTVGAGYTAALLAACIATLFLCLSYLNLQAGLETRRSSIQALEVRLQHMKIENDELQTKIKVSTDLSTVYDKAVHQLHMVYPGQEQVLFFHRSDHEYVEHDEDLP